MTHYLTKVITLVKLTGVFPKGFPVTVWSVRTPLIANSEAHAPTHVGQWIGTTAKPPSLEGHSWLQGWNTTLNVSLCLSPQVWISLGFVWPYFTTSCQEEIEGPSLRLIGFEEQILGLLGLREPFICVWWKNNLFP